MAILNYIFFYFYVRKNSTVRVALTSKFANHVVPEVVLKYVSKCGKFRQTMRTCLLDNYCMSKILRPTVVFCAKRSIYQTYISFKHATFYSNLVVHIRDHYINIPFHVESMAIVIGVIQRSFMDFIWITILMFVFIFLAIQAVFMANA